MTKLKPEEVNKGWRDTMFVDWSANYEDFFSEHDTTLGDGFERNNDVLVVDGVKFGRFSD